MCECYNVGTMRLFIERIYINKDIPKQNYLNKIPVINKLKEDILSINKPVTIFVGENGTGKSTLIEAMAITMGFNPEGGSRNIVFSTNDSHSNLHEFITVSRGSHPKDGFFLRAESLYNVASSIDELDSYKEGGGKIIYNYGGVSLHNQSHGESFLALVKNRFGPNGLYILDEPEAALSPTRMMQLLCLIHDLEKQGSQFIIATHSPILMSYPNASIIEFSDLGFKEVNYKETEHYLITKEFINNSDKMYKYLFEE